MDLSSRGLMAAALFLFTGAFTSILAQTESATQTPPEEYKVYTEAPRLFLRQQRLRLIRRERERDSIRWQQFNLLMSGKARMPEPGFASALYFRAGAGEAAGRDAIVWAASAAATDPRQLALVYDWCQELMTPAQKALIVAKLRPLLTGKGSTAAAVHARTLAAVAIADAAPEASEAVLRATVRDWWRGQIVPAIAAGKAPIRREEMHLLLELMHVIRDNTNIDMRDDSRKWFKDLPARQLLSYYPAPIATAENEFRVPVFSGGGEPDLKHAVFSRATEFMMVAFDPNVLENQFVQGWLIQDRYLMRGAFGIPYEFLWASPYQPGLSVFKLDPFYHDTMTGTFYVRASWDEDSDWFGVVDGKLQLFEEGRVKLVTRESISKPLQMGNSTIVVGHDGMRFEVEEEEKSRYFLFGMEPRAAYDVEVDNEELYEARADGGGILLLTFQAGTKAGVRLNRAGAGAASPAGSKESVKTK